MSDSIVWMTYAEIAEAFGIGGDSARNLVRRKRWQRTQGNDGLARVGVPSEAIADRPPADAPTSPPVDTPTDGEIDPPTSPPSDPPIVAEALAALSRHIERLEADVLRLSGQLDDERARSLALSAEASAAAALRETVENMKGSLAEVKEDRDHWRRQATAPRGLFALFRRAG